MLCQRCQKRNASVHFTQIINNKKTEMYLCEQCARENEKSDINMGAPLGLNDLLTGLLGINPNVHMGEAAPEQIHCEKCGMTYEEFQRTGKFGCSDCYEVFEQKLGPLFKRLHGSTGHVGKIPGNASSEIKSTREIEKLKELLNKSIQNEDYEKAAEIRDKIKRLSEQKLK
ncbi:protein arginine kinase activator [Anaerobacterium chartisolvens]|uniref:Protein arginine kinase activator n=1 Tax=Anaerobacterium chartisolvens TaxID=1297424 RepID=A0A369AKT9_9FIRM|nr:UvrB/UvrC motif-containing protein [Anaerobacterium chartisolvens]RCX09982.1 protein arginine kinase activator [Anaerobacterium chartisolvens]